MSSFVSQNYTRCKKWKSAGRVCQLNERSWSKISKVDGQLCWLAIHNIWTSVFGNKRGDRFGWNNNIDNEETDSEQKWRRWNCTRVEIVRVDERVEIYSQTFVLIELVAQL